MAKIPEKMLEKKGDQIQELLSRKMTVSAIQQLKITAESMTFYQAKVKELTQIARFTVLALYPKEFAILCSMPGVGEITAMTILSEVGNLKEFPSGDKLAAWAGLVPKVYQSADHNVRAGITRRGSKHLRWVMVQAAHAATRQKKSMFRDFYEGKKIVLVLEKQSLL